MQENKENLRSVSNISSPFAYLKKRFFSTEDSFKKVNESTLMEDASLWHQQSDNTFETLERMCNKTLSDPNNTIHEFLANWEKKSISSNRTDKNDDEETDALNRLFEEFGIDDSNGQLLHGNETRLSEIEPPSCLWENSNFTNESTVQTSPIKMIGMLRPSTILEESITDCISNAQSFKSAQRGDLDSTRTTSSGQYETANETNSGRSSLRSSSGVSGSNASEKSSNSASSRPAAAKDYFDMFPLKKVSLNESRIYNRAMFLNRSGGITKTTRRSSSEYSSTNEKPSLSIDSLDRSRKQSSGDFMEDSLNVSEQESTAEINEDESSVITISDDENDTKSGDDFNKGFMRSGSMQNTSSSLSVAESSGLNVSREFNDTLEEIEYIMKQGQKYLANKSKSPPKAVQTPPPKRPKSPLHLLSPMTPCTVIKKPKPIASKPPRPISPPRLAKPIVRTKSTSKYDYIRSPIHAYIHNTAKSPITTSMKPTQNLFESKYGRASRQPRNNSPVHMEELKAPCSLPRKAYVSAEFTHIVDQRSPSSMPGGNKIHRYLEPSRVPSVLRHEGKYRTEFTSSRKKDFDQTKNSLADFSLASGDMSILLLKDAKGFASK